MYVMPQTGPLLDMAVVCGVSSLSVGRQVHAAACGT
jgi:hypothetical protein